MRRLLATLILLLVSLPAQAQLGIEGGNLATLVAQLGAVTASPPANTIGDRLKTINTTLGSPFQAGANIGNTTFAATQGTSPWVVSNSGTFATQLTGATNNINNIAGTITLPTGAATAAKQPALGTAGTASTDVITVQGAASMTKLLVTPDSVALPANQSVNVAQVNGVTTSVNTGAAGTGTQRVTLSNTDPCASPDIAKSSKAISVTSATTTSLVAVSGSTITYVCGFVMTIAPSATSADTAAFEYGTGASCTSPVLLTGTFGNGDLTSAAPVVSVSYSGPFTLFKSAASNGICILTTGTAVNVQGVLTYVQQ